MLDKLVLKLKCRLLDRDRVCPPKHHENNDPTIFRFQGCDIRELVDKVTQWASHRESDASLSTMQQSALDDYRTNPIYQLSNVKGFGEKAVLRAYFLLFDKLFFGQTLERYTELHVPDRDWSWGRKISGQNFWRICWFSRTNFLKVQCGITVYPRNKISDMKLRCLQRIGILLHEMIHVFFRIYHHQKSVTWPVYYSTLGYTGHGPAWQEVAYALEQACRDPGFLNLGSSLKLSRRSHFLCDYSVSNQYGQGYENNPWGLDVAWAEQICIAMNTAAKRTIGFGDIVPQVMRQVGVNCGCIL